MTRTPLICESGPIRFVGGPWHNRIVDAGKKSGYWRPVVSINVSKPISIFSKGLSCTTSPPVIEMAHYQLELVCVQLTGRGAIRFLEYHYEDMDPNHAVSSGGDGVCTNMKVSVSR